MFINMPHLIVEHSKNIVLKKDFKALVDQLHSTFAQQETVRLSAVKTRTIVSDNVIVGEGLKDQFLFLKVLLLPGRTDELKQKFSDVLKNVILDHVHQDKCSFCIEIAELQHYYTQ
jgi:5-carboxymethyl-2-hydroxymuconate isomerase